MRTLIQDLGYALRQMRKSPGFVLIAVVMRMALGAQRREVRWLIMRESLVISAIGMMVGLPLAMTCSRFLDSMLYELSPIDPLSFLLAVCAIALVGTAAAFFPAWRAAKLDPMAALRYE